MDRELCKSIIRKWGTEGAALFLNELRSRAVMENAIDDKLNEQAEEIIADLKILCQEVRKELFESTDRDQLNQLVRETSTVTR